MKLSKESLAAALLSTSIMTGCTPRGNQTESAVDVRQTPVACDTSATVKATLSNNSARPNASILTPSSVEMEVMRFTLSVTEENAQLTDIYMYNGGTAHLARHIQSISLYDVSGKLLSRGSVSDDGMIHFSAEQNSPFVIPANAFNSQLMVKAAFKHIDIPENDEKSLELRVGVPDGYNTSRLRKGTIGGVRIISAQTGHNITSVCGAASSNKHLLAVSRPIFMTRGSATASTHTFAVAADPNGQINLADIRVEIRNPTGAELPYSVYVDRAGIEANKVATGRFRTGYSESTVLLSSRGIDLAAGSLRELIFQIDLSAMNAAPGAQRSIRIVSLTYINYHDKTDRVTIIDTVDEPSNLGIPTTKSVYTY